MEEGLLEKEKEFKEKEEKEEREREEQEREEENFEKEQEEKDKRSRGTCSCSPWKGVNCRGTHRLTYALISLFISTLIIVGTLIDLVATHRLDGFQIIFLWSNVITLWAQSPAQYFTDPEKQQRRVVHNHYTPRASNTTAPR